MCVCVDRIGNGKISETYVDWRQCEYLRAPKAFSLLQRHVQASCAHDSRYLQQWLEHVIHRIGVPSLAFHDLRPPRWNENVSARTHTTQNKATNHLEDLFFTVIYLKNWHICRFAVVIHVLASEKLLHVPCKWMGGNRLSHRKNGVLSSN